jgi:hypothetical protein
MKTLCIILSLLSMPLATYASSQCSSSCYLTTLNNQSAVVGADGKVLASFDPMNSLGGSGISKAMISLKNAGVCPTLRGSCSVEVVAGSWAHLEVDGIKVAYDTIPYVNDLQAKQAELTAAGICK